MDGGQFMHFATQLFIGLLIQTRIFHVDGDNTGNYFYKIDLFTRKVAWLA